MVMDKIIESLEYNDDCCCKSEIIEENIKDKDTVYIQKYLNQNIKNLIDIQPDEIGGLTAVTGFYYQFLVTIEYMIEMKEDKWDCIAIELHDDIVAIKENKIRFIQVKTSKHPASTITDEPANSLHQRSSKKDGDKKYNSWVDKLIDKAKYFKNCHEIDLEFELITSFNIIDKEKSKIDNYRIREKTISDSDYIYSRISKDSLLDYENIYGKSLKDLLASLYINDKGDNIAQIDKCINNICKRLEHCIGKYISINKDDIDWIIGKMCSICNVSSKGHSLVIESKLLSTIFDEIECRATKRVEDELEGRGTKTIINNVYTKIHEELEGSDHYKQIETKLSLYKEDLIEWINNNGGIKPFINRYLSGSKYINKYGSINDTRRDNVIKEILIMPIILELIYNSKNKYVDNTTLLIKNIANDNNEKLSLMGVEKINCRFGDRQLDTLKNILNQLEDDEILRLCALDKLNIILQGYRDSSFNKVRAIEIEEKLKLQGKEVLNEFLNDNKNSLKNVDIVAHILPGESIKKYIIEDLLPDEEEEWNISKIEEYWNEIIGR